MAGSQTVIEKIESKSQQLLFVNSLRKVLELAKKEEKIISEGNSDWSISLIQNIIVPEMSALLSYAEKKQVYFKYGKEQRLLESTYYVGDALKPLQLTKLGKAIYKVQDIINEF